MKKKYDPCLPLDFLKNIFVGKGDVLLEIERLRKENEINNFSEWPSWCYIPIKKLFEMIFQITKDYNSMRYVPFAQVLSALCPWRASKQIYIMDPDAEKIICDSSDSNIPSEFLLKLPYPCFYIKTNYLTFYNKKIDGFFAYLDYDTEKKQEELRFLFLYPDKTYTAFWISLMVDTIDKNFKLYYDEIKSNIDRKTFDQVKEHTANLQNEIRKALNLVLYILSINADIHERKRDVPYNPPKTFDGIRDNFREIKEWDVGVIIGSAIRKRENEQKNKTEINDSEDDEEGQSNNHRRPHMRRGHWHHYWTGPKNGDRKLILKWVAPVFIGLRTDNDPVVARIVK